VAAGVNLTRALHYSLMNPQDVMAKYHDLWNLAQSFFESQTPNCAPTRSSVVPR